MLRIKPIGFCLVLMQNNLKKSNMKKVLYIAILAMGLNGFAQDQDRRPSREEMEQLNPEQRNQLMLKKMTLDLDLNAKQQEQISKIIAEQSAKHEAMKAERKAMKEKEKAERFERRNKMLDEQIAMKNKLKDILTPEQMTKWEAHKEKNKEHFRGKMGDWKEKNRKDRED